MVVHTVKELVLGCVPALPVALQLVPDDGPISTDMSRAGPSPRHILKVPLFPVPLLQCQVTRTQSPSTNVPRAMM